MFWVTSWQRYRPLGSRRLSFHKMRCFFETVALSVFVVWGVENISWENKLAKLCLDAMLFVFLKKRIYKNIYEKNLDLFDASTEFPDSRSTTTKKYGNVIEFRSPKNWPWTYSRGIQKSTAIYSRSKKSSWKILSPRHRAINVEANFRPFKNPENCQLSAHFIPLCSSLHSNLELLYERHPIKRCFIPWLIRPPRLFSSLGKCSILLQGW